MFPLLKNDQMETQIREPLFLFLVLATLCLAAAGYVINDYFDRKADLINRPEKVILGRILSRRAGMVWHTILTLIGILLGSYVSYKIGHLKFSLVFFVVSGLLWFYSTSYKRQVLLGNLVVAILVACVPLILIVFELPLLIDKYSLYIKSMSDDLDILAIWFVGYSGFAFLLNFMREIVKDLEDFEGDFAFGRQTIPIAWGLRTAKIIVLVSAVITGLFLIMATVKLRWSMLTVLYSFVLLILPLVVFMFSIYKASTKKQYHNSSNILKIIMLSGLLYLVVGANWVF